MLEFLLKFFQVGLRLVPLRLQELESAFPKSSLLVKQVPLLLQFGGGVIELTSDLLIAVGGVDLAVLEHFGQVLIVVSQVGDFALVVADELLSLRLQVEELLLKHSLLGLTR